MAKKRDNIKKEIYKIPDNYFEDFTNNLMLRVKSEERKKTTGILSIARPHLMLAASMIILVVISYSLLRVLLPDVYSNELSDNSAEITEYLMNGLDDYTLIETLTMSEELTSDENHLSLNLSNDEIIDYLIDENINYEEIIEKF